MVTGSATTKGKDLGTIRRTVLSEVYEPFFSEIVQLLYDPSSCKWWKYQSPTKHPEFAYFGGPVSVVHGEREIYGKVRGLLRVTHFS